MKEEELTTGDVMSLYIITFDHSSASDLDPKKLSHLRKYLLTTLVSLTSFTRILISTLPAPALPEMAATLSLSPVEAAMSMTIYLLATALGPLLISPLSELYGRSIILHTTNVWFLAWNLACGLAPSKGVLLTARFFAGFGAAAAYAVGTGVLGDIWTTEQRGKSLSYYSVIPMIGAAMGPIVGGAMADHLSWRWIFFATSIFQAVLVVLFILCFQETYGPTILARQAARMRRVQGDERYTTAHEVQCREITSSSPNSGLKSRRDVVLKSKYVLHALSRPLRLLFFHPVVQICGMSMAIGYGTLYVILTSLAGLFTDVYDASATASGLHYLAAALGEMVAAQVCGPLMDWLYSRQKNRWQAARSNSGLGSGDAPEVPPEESRMPLAVWASLVPCAGLLLYGWSAAYKVHWAVVDVGVFLTALGLQMAGMPRVAYLVDTYPAHVSSAIAATQFMSSLSAFLFPLFTPALYGHLGYGFGNTLVAGVVALVSVPSAWVLWKFGQRLRSRKSSF